MEVRASSNLIIFWNSMIPVKTEERPNIKFIIIFVSMTEDIVGVLKKKSYGGNSPPQNISNLRIYISF